MSTTKIVRTITGTQTFTDPILTADKTEVRKIHTDEIRTKLVELVNDLDTHIGNVGDNHGDVTATDSGFMSSAQKALLDEHTEDHTGPHGLEHGVASALRHGYMSETDYINLHKHIGYGGVSEHPIVTSALAGFVSPDQLRVFNEHTEDHTGPHGLEHGVASATRHGYMSETDYINLHKHIGYGGEQEHPNVNDTTSGFMSVSEHIALANHIGSGGSSHADVNTTTSGFMSAAMYNGLEYLINNPNNVTLFIGMANHGDTIPIPAGYTEAQCLWGGRAGVIDSFTSVVDTYYSGTMTLTPFANAYPNSFPSDNIIGMTSYPEGLSTIGPSEVSVNGSRVMSAIHTITYTEGNGSSTTTGYIHYYGYGYYYILGVL